ncbi:MAG TPA: D-aminoacylase [Jiangellaceae bacterium]|nr:D-aminoacylase [Jiangellaceae bacterium]
MRRATLKVSLVATAAAALVVPLMGAAPSPTAQRTENQQAEFDVIIRNGTVLDGTGEPAEQTDVAVNDQRIAAIGDLSSSTAADVIDASGLHVTPGFIDRHTHMSPTDPTPLLTQGITTIGVNPDGGGQVDLVQQRGDLLDQGVGVNFLQMIGHNAVRSEVMGEEDRAPTRREMAQMRTLVREAMRDGAFGLSSGLFYTPGFFAETEELVELAKPAARFGGVYTSHIRDEANANIGVLDAVGEVIEVARQNQMPGVVTHIKTSRPAVWGLTDEVIDTIDAARANGHEVWADQYPYTRSATSFTAYLVPQWARDGGRDALLERLADPETRAQIVEEMEENLERFLQEQEDEHEQAAERILLTSGEFSGSTLAEVSAQMDATPIDAALAIVEQGEPSAVAEGMSEENVQEFMQQPWTMASSDGVSGHPRGHGTFPRIIETYVQEHGTITLSEAIFKSTGQVAEIFGIAERGVIQEGNFADIAVFDLDDVEERATFEDPAVLSEGMVHVLVNGEFAIEDGERTDTMPGRSLQK